MKYCKSCDKKYSDKLKFCEECGGKLTDFVESRKKENVKKDESNEKSILKTLSNFPRKYIAIGVVVILLIAFALSRSNSSNGGINDNAIQTGPPSEVTVTGNIQASGQGTYATKIIFTTSSGQSYSSSVYSDGSYSISLSNQKSYIVSAIWSGQYSWQSGECNLSSFNLNSLSSSTYQQNFYCPTPSSTVSISGNVNTVGAGTHATMITFLNSGQRLTATVNNGAYQITLPNSAQYEITVDWSGIAGYTGQCHPNPSTFSLSVDVGINSETVNWSC